MNESFRKAFENIKPSDELVKRTLAAEALPQKKKTCRSLNKRIFGAVFAVCAALVCGLTAAAAAGIIDFKEIFGDNIIVENKNTELANSLVGTVKNFRYKVSDEDYKIGIKGVTGTDKSIIALAELSRADGEPAANHFINPLPDDEIGLSGLWEELYVNDSSGFEYSIYLSDEGNIEFYIIAESEYVLNGETLTVKGENFYPSKKHTDFMIENNVWYWDDKNGFSGYVSRNTKDLREDIDDSGIIALDMDWEFSFEYAASERALNTKSSFEPEKSFVYYQNVHRTDGEGDESGFIVHGNTANNVRIEIGALSGRIRFEHLPNEFEKANLDNPATYGITCGKNEVFFIMADGTEIPSKFGGGSESCYEGTLFVCDYELMYSVDDIRKEVIEVDDIAAVSVNGTVYELS